MMDEQLPTYPQVLLLFRIVLHIFEMHRHPNTTIFITTPIPTCRVQQLCIHQCTELLDILVFGYEHDVPQGGQFIVSSSHAYINHMLLNFATRYCVTAIQNHYPPQGLYFGSVESLYIIQNVVLFYVFAKTTWQHRHISRFLIYLLAMTILTNT